MIDLLVVTFNTIHHIEKLLTTLNSDYEQNVWSLYIQDNGSTDGTAEWLEENGWKYGVSEFIRSDNVGYSKAINHLSTLGDSDILAAVNGDTWFTTNHVKQVQKSFDDHPEQAICGPKQMDEGSCIRHGGIFWGGRAGGYSPRHRGWAELDSRDIMYKDRQKCWTVSGSLYYIRRGVWNELSSCPPYRGVIESNEPGAFLPTPHYY